MKAKHVSAEAINARATLRSLNIAVDQDFHTLNRTQVDVLLSEANRVRYQKPKNANGSRARYFFALLQRRARMGA